VQEALVEFGAHESFERAAQRLARHYPVKLSDSTVRKITIKAGQKARARQEREGGVGALPAHGVECVEAQADGTMLPMLGFKSGIKDKRKGRKCHWQEQRPDELAVARNAKRYLANRTDQLWYDEALKLGRSIGSGLIEGSHRHVLQQRLKLSGAWWLPENAKAMSHLRVHLANNDFDSLFPLAC
jgi:hypothetical protein